MRKIFLLVFAAATLSAQNAPSKSQSQQDLERILDRISGRLDKILKILEEADAPPPPVKVDVSKSPVLGMDKAPITIVEFTDMQCPYCNKFHTETFPALHDEFIVSGMVRYVSRDLPLPMHKNALQAAEAGRCAGEQGHFWEMRDWMQSNPAKLELDDLQAHASEINLDLGQYRACMATGKYKSAVTEEAKQAQDMHITGTPTFIIGKSGSTIEGQVITGAQPLSTFEKAILALE